MDSIPNKPHFVLIPLMAQGHMIPMTDMARNFAERGVVVSLITTPQNASRFESIISRARKSKLPIQLVQIPFPCQEVGLPVGYENLDNLPSPDLLRKFYIALDKLQEPLEKFLLEKGNPPPSCIISDKCLSWTSETAQKLKIPRLVFHGMCSFSLLSSHTLMLHKAHNSVTSDSEPFLIPLPAGITQRIEVTKAQLPGAFVSRPDFDDFRNKMQEAEQSAAGVVVNSFHELENGFVDEYEKAIGKKVWCIGPVSFCNREKIDKFERGNNKASIDDKQCLEFLNSMKPRSVIYACLGSLCRLVPSQLIEIGLGLEASRRPFIWVIKSSEELEKWLLEENFEEKIKGRGLLIKGWAPQIFILSHQAIGGFLTHCGWNSTLEGISFGVPMITWPLFAEQFFNEKLIVQVLEVGIRVGVEIPVRWGEEEKIGILVKRDEVEKAVNILMDEGEEGQKRRERVRQLQLKATKAMEKDGSSHLSISLLIRHFTPNNV
ncbi:Glycosyltransferase [Melia azedarach]|uniref:Glycosyltransferase n=1 Tax=Melia azedarach TaxID=155640 RepID=A0ACC1X4C6_MELAZ|nr:Glycosyltransferase [Melia azedarach]